MSDLARMPEYSREVAFYWDMYLSINKGCERITYSELAAYSAATGLSLSLWESNLMIDVDMMRRSHG